MTEQELERLNDACDLVEQAHAILLNHNMGLVPYIRDLRDAVNDARNKLNRVIQGNPAQ